MMMGRTIKEARPTDITDIMQVMEAAKIMNFCFSHDANIRIDTHKDNRIMQHNIEKHGFTYCGIIYLANGDERLAYQKLECSTAFHILE